MSDSQIIYEVMEGAPPSWNTILNTQLYPSVVEFQNAIRYHEDTLLRLDSSGVEYRSNRDYSERSRNPFYKATANLANSEKSYAFPKDDANVSARATPESKGARPCRNCGSGKHWDRECKHHREGRKMARARLAETSTIEEELEQLRDQEEYDDLYYSLGEAGTPHDLSAPTEDVSINKF
jgi:hypothetical protein